MYTQDQINAVCKSYSDEIVRLLETKYSYALAIQDLRRKLYEKDKEIEELKKKLPVEKPKTAIKNKL